MATFNSLTLIGRLTDTPEPVHTFASGAMVVRFRFAVGRSRKNRETGQWENDPNPLYIDCEVWGKEGYTALVELVRSYCHKGTECLLDGTLEFQTWEDKNTGQKRSKHLMKVTTIQLLGGRSGNDGGNGGQSQPAPRQQHSEPGSYDGEEIPF